MANTQKYLNHLLQTVGITPACSEEERVAAEEIARIFSNHGFEPEIQEFTSSSSPKLVRAIFGCVLFVATVLMGIGGAVGVVGTILAIACGAVFVLERLGRISLPQIGAGGLSQNVIAYHKASGPLASPRNRPVVVVAHYDSPRADILAQAPFSSYRHLLVKLLPAAMVIPAIIGVLRILPLPEAAKIVLWVVAILASLVPLFNAVAIILNRYVLPYTSGSVCNKSSVAAMLGVMDAVAPFKGGNEFPEDRSFDEYMDEQQSLYTVEPDAGDDGAPAVPYGEGERADGTGIDEQEDPFREEPVEDGFTIVPDIDFAADDEVEADEEQVPLEGATITMPALQDIDLVEEAFDGANDSLSPDETPVDEGPVEDERPVLPINEAGCIRYGADALRSLGMVAASCAIEYEQDALPASTAARAAQEAADAAAVVAPDIHGSAPAVPAAPVIEEAPEGKIESTVEPELAPAADDSVVEPELALAADSAETSPSDDDFVDELEPEGVAADEPIFEPEEIGEEYEAEFAEDDEDDEDGWGYDEEELESAVVAIYERLDDEDEIVEDGIVEESEIEALENEEPADDGLIEEESLDDVPADDELIEEELLDDVPADDELIDGEEPVDEWTSAEEPLYDERDDEPFEDAADEAGLFDEPSEDEVAEDGFAEDEETVASDEEPAGALVEDEDDVFSSSETIVFEPLGDEEIATEEEAAEPLYDDDVDIMEGIYEVIGDEEPDDDEDSDGSPADVASEVELEKTSAFVPMDPTLARDDEGAPPEVAQEEAELLVDESALDETIEDDGIEEDAEDVGAHEGVEEGIEEGDGEDAPDPATGDPQAPLGGATQAISMSAVLQGTQPFQEKTVDATQPRHQETVDSLMAEIAAARPQRPINIPDIAPSTPRVTRTVPPVVPAIDPAPRTIAEAAPAANRASLLDLPDPSNLASDPFANVGATGNIRVSAPSTSQFTVINSDDVVTPSVPAPGTFDTIKAPVPQQTKKKKRGLFGRKKKQDESSMSEWLGVDSSYDAKRSGRNIGSWDNFEGDDGWKGGATGNGAPSESELREAITSLGDDELLGHDIWFVATGSSENGNAGARAFLESHRDRLRGVFLINLECVGSGMLAMISSEGERRVLKGDKRIMGLISRVSADFHHEIGAVDMPFIDTDAHAAMEMSLRSVTLGGVDGVSFSCSHSTEDIPVNVNTDNIDLAADVVTEVIRRS